MFKLMKRISLLLMCVFATLGVALNAQNITVKGTVTDRASGEPISGAAVVVQGNSTSYALTDSDGAFTINVAKDGFLVVSNLGYKTAQVAVNGATTVAVTLEEDAEYLDEVVVTAQGLTRKQKAIGYSAQVINEETLTMTHSSELGNSLAGKVAGAQFWGAGGATFNEGSIVLRGATSYSDAKGNAPIYVIDGVIASSNAVNMDDVASVNILKGPSATAMYGSRGANGAVIITTKKAEDGQSHVEFSHTTAVETLYNHIKLNNLYGGGSMAAGVTKLAYAEGADAHDYTSASYLFGEVGEMVVEDGIYYMDYGSDENWGPRFDGKTLVRPAISWDPSSPKYGVAETWESRLKLSDLTRAAWSNTTNVAFSKSVKGMNTRVAFTNVDRQGVMFNSKAVRRSFSITTSIKPASWINADISYRFRMRKNQNAATEGYSAEGNVVCDFTQWGQTNVNIADYKDYMAPDGSWRTWNIESPTKLAPRYHDNPYGTLYNYNSDNTMYYHIIGADIYTVLPFNIRVGGRFNSYMTNAKYEAKHGSGSINWDPYFRTYQNNSSDFTAQGYVTYGGQFVDNKLSVEAAAFAEARGYDYYYLNSATNGGLSLPGFFNLKASNSTYSTNNSEEHFKTRAFFATATIGWDDLVYLDGSFRYDIDSRLPDSSNGYPYGGGSLSFMASKLIDAPWLNFWKIRGSIAQTGSVPDAYNVYSYYSVGSKVHNLPAMYEPNEMLNPNIKPTISTSYEVGTEFKMFDNRFYGDFNFYVKNTKDDIISANALPQAGYAYRTMNAGLVRNQGVELVLGGVPVKTKNVEWSLSANIARNVNTLVQLAPDQKEYTIYWSGFSYRFYEKAIEGKPIGVIETGSRFARNEEGKYILRDGNTTWGEVRPTYETNKNKEVGNMQPLLTGGFATNLRVGQFSLGASLDFMLGGKIVSWTNMWGEGSGTLLATAGVNPKGVNVREPVAAGGGVYVEGVDADGNPKSGYVDAYNWYHDKATYDLDSWVYVRTYVKLREVSLRYDLPKKFLQSLNIGLSQASVALVATNPWLIYSAVPNLDPSEVAGTEYNFLEGGQAMSTRSVGLTINVTF